MIRHIVMWKLVQAPEPEHQAHVRKVRELLESCRDCVPGMVEFEIGSATPGLECTYDVILNSLFDSPQALDAYQKHPLHVAVKPFMSSVKGERQCMDYEVPAR